VRGRSGKIIGGVFATALFLPLSFPSALAFESLTYESGPGLIQSSPHTVAIKQVPGFSPRNLNLPQIDRVTSFISPQNLQILRLQGSYLSEVRAVLVDGERTSFYLNSDNLITARIPVAAKPGDVKVTLEGAFGALELSDYLFLPGAEVPKHPDIDIQHNGSELVVTVTDLEGKRLSVKVGSRWQVVEQIQDSEIVLRFKTDAKNTITVIVFLDRTISKITQIQPR
jgi:hypothetical protein